MKIDLYNFNHIINPSQSIDVGPFTITANQQQCENVKNIYRTASKTFNYDENLNPIYYTNPTSGGGWNNTATLTVASNNFDKSILVPNENEINQIHDFCNLLTFLTGRRVTVKECINQHNPYQSLGFSLPNHTIMHNFSELWGNMSKLSDANLGVQFINLTYAFESVEFLGMSAYITSTLDAIYNSWWKKHTGDKINKSTKRKIKNSLRKYISNSLFCNIKIKLINILHDKEIHTNITDDIDKMINGIGNPSALFILEKFVIYLKIYPKENTENPKKRLRFINTLRNILVHSGKIPKIPGESLQQEMEIALSTITICLEIVKLFFLEEIFHQEGFHINSMRSELQSYFKSGKFRGKYVFNESYAAFVERQEIAWIEKGTRV